MVPLIYWTIKYAKNIQRKDDIIVSSDSDYINKISVKEKVKFLKDLKIFLEIKRSIFCCCSCIE